MKNFIKILYSFIFVLVVAQGFSLSGCLPWGIAMASSDHCGNGICEQGEDNEICQQDCCGGLFYQCFDSAREDCLSRGWKEIIVDVDGLPRRMMWKGPEGSWRYGAIIVLHGGGGSDINYCGRVAFKPGLAAMAINNLNEPMVEFTDLAIREGFAVFALDSTYDLVKDPEGRPVGKRWDSLVVAGQDNRDLPFIEEVIMRTIPGLQPAGSSGSVFMTGISNGGFMTILAGTRLSDRIAAFAPVSAGDPYGTYFDMGTHPRNERGCAPGVWRDNATKEMIHESGGCASEGYLNEEPWPQGEYKPSFKQFHHKGDAACDYSCMVKVRAHLTGQGYKDAGAMILKGRRSALKHFWHREYNKPMIDFFKEYSSSRILQREL